MKQLLSTALIVVISAVFSTASFSQGRHDEKPHGIMKSAPGATEKARASGTGGRHDEAGTTHGKKRPVAKKDNSDPQASAKDK